MSGVSNVLGVLRSSPTTAAFPAMFLMSWLRPATTASLLGVEEFLDCAESGGNERDLAKEVGLEDGEGDDAKEQGDESSELQLKESKERKELLDLLLLLATAYDKIHNL
jgi:hypothetical protein